MKLAVPGFEPGLPDSESGVLTTTLYRSYQAEVAKMAFAEYMFTDSRLWCCILSLLKHCLER